MNALLYVLTYLHDSVRLSRIRVRCLRHGHLFLCITDGHLCTRCGRFWGFYD